LGEVFNDKTEHLTQKHALFFEKWEKLISLEEQDLARFRREIWTLTSEMREKLGRYSFLG
jgi:DNA replication ATP-dependent helicase Dna2